MPQTYSQFQEQVSSEKVGLAIVEGSRRLNGWEQYAGSVYVLDVSEQVIVSVDQDGQALEAGEDSFLFEGTYFHDREAGRLYLHATDDVDPDSVFIALTFKLFFSNVPVNESHDLSTGYAVHWEPLLVFGNRFTTQVENTKNLLGIAISSASSVQLINDQEYWADIWDGAVFESHRVEIYSWSRSLPITEAHLFFRGTIVKKTYAANAVSFELKDLFDALRAPVIIPFIGSRPNIRVTDGLFSARQRTVYGQLSGHVPTPIDQVLAAGYPLTGQITVTSGSVTMTGVGSQFLKEISPGDEVIVGDLTSKLKVDSIESNTSATLSDALSGNTQPNADAFLFAFSSQRWMNRRFLVAGHPLTKISLTVSEVIDASTFFLDTTDLSEGDTLEFDGSTGAIRVLGDGFVRISPAFLSTPSAGDTVFKAAIFNVFLDENRLELTRDYTYDEDTAEILLDELAEFNVALQQKLPGTSITLSNGSRNVTGSSTQFTGLRPGDWLRRSGTSGWYEVLSVTDDTHLVVRTAVAALDAGTSSGLKKKPAIYQQGQSIVTCDCLGKKDEDGVFLKTAAQITKDLLIQTGLEDDLDLASFELGASLLPHRLGLAIPHAMNDRSAPVVRDTLNVIMRSTFASLIQNDDFKLEFAPVEPSYSGELPKFEQHDMLSFNIDSDATNVISDAAITWAMREYDPNSQAAASRVTTQDNTLYLLNTQKEFAIDTLLIDEEDAIIFAARWALLLGLASSEVTMKTGMQGARLNVNDTIILDHPKFYRRFGATDHRRIGVVLSITKSFGSVSLVVSDLGNAFAKIARIAPTGTADFNEVGGEEQLKSGFQTDENGLTNDKSGLNLIW